MATKTKIYSKKIVAKRQARILAVQALYAYDSSDTSIGGVDQMLVDIVSVNDILIDGATADEVDTKYFLKLARGTITQIELLDGKISRYLSENWRIERLPKVVKAILRTATFEVLNTTDIDQPILINEYLEIARLFEHSGEVGFINKVLDSIAKEKK